MKHLYKLLVVLIFIYIGWIYLNSYSYESADISAEIEKVKVNLSRNQEIVIFDSKNPFNFYDIFKRVDKIEDQQVFGVLSIPISEGEENFPLVVGFAGSKNWSSHHYGYLKRYYENGFATLAIHSFKSRKVESTVGEQASVTTAMMIADAFAAINKVSKDYRINSSKIGITGWSLGGGVALFTAWKPIQEALSPNIKFAAHLPIYPPCIAIPDEFEFTDAPIHILIGEYDNWVPADACTEFIGKMKDYGYSNAELTIYPESHHSFDREGPVVMVENAYSVGDCRLVIDKDGITRTKDYRFPMSSPLLQKIGLFFCADRGSELGGNKSAREKSSIFAIEFMNTYLK